MTPSPFQSLLSVLTHEQTRPLQSSNAVVQGTPADSPQVQAHGAAPVGQIAVDIYEQENYFIIRAPIAGVKLSDLDIEVDGKSITVRGHRTLPDDIEQEKYFVQECFWGEFSRTITLPTSIDSKKVKATFSKDSILKILIPKEEKVKIVRINEAG